MSIVKCSFNRMLAVIVHTIQKTERNQQKFYHYRLSKMNIKQDSDESTGSVHDESMEIVFKTRGMSLV